MRYKKAYIYTFLAVLLWSFIPVISSLGGKSLGVEAFLLFSNLLSTIAVAPFVKFDKFNFNLRYIFFSFILSLLGIFGYYLLLYYAYFLSNDAVTILIIQYLWPIFIALFSIFLLKEEINTKKILALLFGFVSAFLVISKGSFHFSFDFISISLAFIASISFALYSVLSKKIASKNPANDIFIYFLIATLLSLSIFLYRGKSLHVSNFDILYLLINGIFINGISYLFWIWALKDGEASKLSVFTLATPLLSILWIYIFLGEEMRWIYLVSLILTILSGFLATEKK